MRKFAISDIHGSFNEMIKLFEFVKFDPTVDELIVIGDMIDRGSDSGKVLKYLYNLNKKYKNVHVTIGNHEEMMLWYLDGKSDLWMYHGGREAAQSINEAFKKEGVSDIINWVRELPLVYEDNHFVFAHAGINIPYGMVEQDREILWFEKNDFYEIKKESLLFYTNDKTVVHGHTPGSYVAFDGVRICIDLGAQVLDNGKLSLVELNEMIYFEYCFEDEQIQKQYIKKAE